MLFAKLWDVLCSAIAWLIGLLPSFSLPSWLTSLPAESSSLGDYLGQFAVWIPIDQVVIVFLFVLSAGVVSLGVRVTRMVISHLSGGGGSVS